MRAPAWRWNRPVAGLIVGLALAAPMQAQTAHVHVVADSVRVGERFRLVLRVESETGIVVPPTPGPVGPLELLREVGRGQALGAPQRPGVRLDSFVYEAAAFALDTLVVPPLRIGLVDGAETLRVASAPVVLRIRRLVPDSSATLKPTRPLQRFGLPWWIFAGLAAALAALVYAIRHARKRPVPVAPPPVVAPAPPLSPRARFLQSLDALQRHLPATIPEAHTFSIAFADAVRLYAEEQSGVHAKEMTSAALVRALERLERTRKAAPGTGVAARRLLAVADLGRYASTCPPPAETQAALDAARTLAVALDAPKRASAPRPSAPTTAPPVQNEVL